MFAPESRRTRIRSTGLLLLLLAATMTRTAAAPTTANTAAPPGGLVRWDGENIERCGLGGQRWLPSDGTCFFPIDLGQPAGPLVISRWRGGQEERRTVTVLAYPYPTQKLTVDDRHVHLSKADLERDQRDKAQVATVWKHAGTGRPRLPLAAPLERLPAGGRFGARRMFNGEARSPHSGADFAAATGTPVLAAEAGVVALAADHFFSGKSIYLDHGDGLYTMYFHLSRLDVTAGEEVRRGQPIGAVGATGRVTGPHLHFGVRWRGAKIDPTLLLGPVETIPAVR